MICLISTSLLAELVPIVTCTGQRMYCLASASTFGAIVAENMMVVRYLLVRLSASSASFWISSSSSDFMMEPMAPITVFTSCSKPSSIMRSASSSTM